MTWCRRRARQQGDEGAQARPAGAGWRSQVFRTCPAGGYLLAALRTVAVSSNLPVGSSPEKRG